MVRLGERHADLWAASASSGGTVHLVPLSFAWNDQHVILATERTSISMRNLTDTSHVRLAVGPTRDVVMIDGVLDSVVAVADATDAIAETYAGQADWDPRGESADLVYVLIRPQRVQAWRAANEIAGRTIMRDGSWIV